jgi:hypothetical protein
MHPDVQLLLLPPEDAARLRGIRQQMRAAGATTGAIRAKREEHERKQFEERWSFLPTAQKPQKAIR